MTRADGRETGVTRLARQAPDQVLSRWQQALGSVTLQLGRELQVEVVDAVTRISTIRQQTVLPRLAKRLCERQPQLGDLIHELAGLRQALHGFVSEAFPARQATDAQGRVNLGIDCLVEACTNAATERLMAAACIDPLTGLRNRRALDRDLPERVALATRGNRPLTVIVADLDGLKTINDVQGHGAGDLALRAMGAALDSALRAGDTAYRIGGDEFLLVLPDTGRHEADTVVARVASVAPSFGWGVASMPEDGVDGAGLIELADGRLLGRRNTSRAERGAPAVTAARRPLAARGMAAASLLLAVALGGIGVGFAADSLLRDRTAAVGTLDSPAPRAAAAPRTDERAAPTTAAGADPTGVGGRADGSPQPGSSPTSALPLGPLLYPLDLGLVTSLLPIEVPEMSIPEVEAEPLDKVLGEVSPKNSSGAAGPAPAKGKARNGKTGNR